VGLPTRVVSPYNPRVPEFDLLDLFLLLLVIVGAAGGYAQGGMRQALGLGGAVAGAFAAVLLLPELAAALPPLDRILRAFLVLAFLLMALAVGQAVGALVAVRIVRRLGQGALRSADRLSGAVLGAGQVFLAAWFLAPFLSVGPSPALASQIRDSVVVDVLHQVLPAPGPIVGRLRAFLAPTGLPQVFQLFENPAGGPVATPQPDEVESIARLASPSIVLVSGDACGMRVTGTGFAVAKGYFVTNAHVVAGERSDPRVSTEADAARATVVLFDPELDVALLYAPELDLPVLRLARGTPPQGSTGATLGHPNGGPLDVEPAAVRDVFRASGYDIYGRDEVIRVVIEMAASVVPGNSGGPFVGVDGTVDGVVFARSSADESTGYALTMPAVSEAIAPGLQSTGAVSTGPCTP
jgi:S1-C subfamily serine protease